MYLHLICFPITLRHSFPFRSKIKIKLQHRTKFDKISNKWIQQTLKLNNENKKFNRITEIVEQQNARPTSKHNNSWIKLLHYQSGASCVDDHHGWKNGSQFQISQTMNNRLSFINKKKQSRSSKIRRIQHLLSLNRWNEDREWWEMKGN